jgi:DNA damage-binding protein 1
MYNYVVTAQRPTSVQRVLKGNFTGPDDVNLIVCRSSRLEVHLLTPGM